RPDDEASSVQRAARADGGEVGEDVAVVVAVGLAFAVLGQLTQPAVPLLDPLHGFGSEALGLRQVLMIGGDAQLQLAGGVHRAAAITRHGAEGNVLLSFRAQLHTWRAGDALV